MKLEAKQSQIVTANATPKPKIRRVPENHNPHLKRGIEPWNPPKMFAGEVVCIIGGGPSLKTFDISITKGQRCIAVNNSYKIAPWADILHFADAEWWRWHQERVTDKFKGIVTTATSDVQTVNAPFVKRFWRNRNEFSMDPTRLHGWDGGTQAVNMAFHLGAAKIVLFGIDMQPAPDGSTQWHNEHRRETRVQNYRTKFAPCLAESIRVLAGLGIPVVRATEPGLPEAPLEPVERLFRLPAADQ